MIFARGLSATHRTEVDCEWLGVKSFEVRGVYDILAQLYRFFTAFVMYGTLDA